MRFVPNFVFLNIKAFGNTVNYSYSVFLPKSICFLILLGSRHVGIKSNNFVLKTSNFIWSEEGNDFSFFDCLSPFCFLLIELHCTFSISYKILQYNFIIVVFWLGSNRPSGLLLSCPLWFFPYMRVSSCLLRVFLNLISFLLFLCVSVRENTRAWVTHFL